LVAHYVHLAFQLINSRGQIPVAIVIMSLEKITTISPITNKPVLTRNGLSDADIQSLPETATKAFETYKRTSLAERQKIVKAALKLLNERQDALGKEITEQMGRPIAYTPKEITTAVMRGEYLLKISEETLADTEGEAEKGFKRYIKKVPLGPVLILFPWNVRGKLLYLLPCMLIPFSVPVFDPRQLASTCTSLW
jgi:acyl-CoA reductase-like NAD-dependent aldehyde dehydrogenase